VTQAYKAVGWNRQKRIYDVVLVAGVPLYLAAFVGGTLVLRPNATIETALIRGLGTCAFLMLHVVLSIGPLARLDRRFLVLLYNRRHLGVAMFVVALAHGALSIVQFHGFSDRNPLLNLLTANTRYESLTQFPFQPLGLLALLILFLMAATSHDFWLTNLTAPQWKRLHMLVYLSYGLLVAHVALGTLQSQTNPVLALVLGLGVAWIVAIHLVAGFKERRVDRGAGTPADDGFVEIVAADAIPDGRAHIATMAGDRIAIFRYGNKISAVSNACKHQNGPLGEGRIVNGCIVCPWHGYEYEPASGQSPPPFTEKIPTFPIKVVAGRVWVRPTPQPPGTFVEPATFESSETDPPPLGPDPPDEFYVGYRKVAPPMLGNFTRRLARGLLAGGVALSLTHASTQERFDPGTFEFGNPRAFAGRVAVDPYPMLAVTPPGAPDQRPEPSRFVLVGFGKAGAEAEIEGLEGRNVELDGTLIYRDDMTMVEVAPASAAPTDDHSHEGSTVDNESLGEQTLAGEIVDLKCYLGVMKPGRGKPHRACATNCIRGGIPPVFVVSDGSGASRHFLLVDEQERAVNERVLGFVAEPIRITGRVVRRDNLYYLKADPSTYERLSGN
jgi:nitrite reductase/ring-hydroxylating ferredoxin subunit/DMSO/TMAO reductase YedYZ heme-binding membrane subunit